MRRKIAALEQEIEGYITKNAAVSNIVSRHQIATALISLVSRYSDVMSLDYSVVSMPLGERGVSCPWCGSRKHLEMHQGHACHFWVQCRNFFRNEDGCFAQGPVGKTREEAVANWNALYTEVKHGK